MNGMPATIARSTTWAERFTAAGLPLLGDDRTRQFGATLLHHAIVDTLARNGVQLETTYSMVSGGNMDFLTMPDPARIGSKKSHESARIRGSALAAASVHFRGAAYVPVLTDRKLAFIHVTGKAFGGTSLAIDLRMEVEDAPRATGNVVSECSLHRREIGLPACHRECPGCDPLHIGCAGCGPHRSP
jgi:myo-inositol-1-phosphate synthase